MKPLLILDLDETLIHSESMRSDIALSKNYEYDFKFKNFMKAKLGNKINKIRYKINKRYLTYN